MNKKMKKAKAYLDREEIPYTNTKQIGHWWTPWNYVREILVIDMTDITKEQLNYLKNL